MPNEMQETQLGCKKAWAQDCNSRREVGKKLASELKRRVKKYDEAEAAAQSETKDFAEAERDRLKGRAQGRIEAHRDAIDEYSRLSSQVKAGVGRLEDLAIKLKKERYERCAQLQVANKRLELRSNRPEPERIDDCLTKEIESEAQALKEIRQELVRREAGVKSFHKKMADMRAQLSADTGNRRIVVQGEVHQLVPANLPSLKKIAEVNNAPDSEKAPEKLLEPPSKPPVALGEGALVLTPEQAEQNREVLTKLATKLLASASSFTDKSLEVIQKSQMDSAQITSQVLLMFAKRQDELGGLRSGLEADVESLTFTINKAEQDLDTHTRRVDPTHKDKVAVIEASKLILKELKDNKEELVEDLHNKVTAQNIDDACRRVRPLNSYDVVAAVAAGKEMAHPGSTLSALPNVTMKQEPSPTKKVPKYAARPKGSPAMGQTMNNVTNNQPDKLDRSSSMPSLGNRTM